jgi:hypothetical protein
LRLCVVVCVAGEHLALEQATAKVFMRLVVGNGSLLFHLAIGRRPVLALHHLVCLRSGTAVKCEMKSVAIVSRSYVRWGKKKSGALISRDWWRVASHHHACSNSFSPRRLRHARFQQRKPYFCDGNARKSNVVLVLSSCALMRRRKYSGWLELCLERQERYWLETGPAELLYPRVKNAWIIDVPRGTHKSLENNRCYVRSTMCI